MKKPDYCPEWFDISKYDETYKWQRREWAIAFEHKIYHYNENLEYAHNPDLGYEINDECLTSWQSLFLGNVNIPNGYRDLQLSKNLVSDDMYKLPFEELDRIYPSPSTSLWFSGLSMRRAAIVDSDGGGLQMDFISNTGIKLPELGKFRYEKKSSEYKHFTPVLINFQDYNDDELKEMFDTFLKQYRSFQLYGGFEPSSKKYDETRKFSDSEIESLNKFRVLPCLDLLIWEVYAGRHFTHEELLFLLFGDGTEATINPKTGKEWFPDKFTIKDSVLPKATQLLEMIANPFMNRYEIQYDNGFLI